MSWLMRLGFLVSPPVVGALSEAVGLRFALFVIPAAGLLVLLLSVVLDRRLAPPRG